MGLRQRLQDDPRLARTGGPLGLTVQQAVAGGAQQQHRRAGEGIDEVPDQIEQRRLGPVDVVEEDDDRSVGGKQLEEAADAPEQLGQLERGRAEPDRRGDGRQHRIGVITEQRGDAPDRQLGRIVVADPGGLAHDLGDRPERDAVPVREASSPEDPRARHHRPDELPRQAGLADARLADDGHHPAFELRDRLVECRAQEAHLRLPADHRRVLASRGALIRDDRGQPIGSDRLGLALERQRLDPRDLDRIPDELVRGATDVHLVDGRCLFEPGRHVHRVAGDQALADAGVSGDDLARVHAGRDLEADRLLAQQVPGERGQAIAQLERGARGAQPVVLVPDGQAEHGHDRVSDVLLDGAPVALENSPSLIERPGHDAPQDACGQRLAVRGGGLEVREHDGHGLARLGDAGRAGSTRPAHRAEPERARVLLPAAGACPYRPGGVRTNLGFGGRRAGGLGCDGDQAVGGDGHRAATGQHRLHALDRDLALDQPERELPDEDPLRRRRLLELVGEPQDVPGQDVLAGRCPPDDELARRDTGPVDEADAPGPIEPLVQAREDRLGLGRSANGSQHIVIARERQAEHRHDGIADDLLDRPAIGLEDGPHLVEVEGQDLAQRLRIELLTEARRALQIRGDDRDPVPDLGGRPVRRQRRPALAADAMTLLDLLATGGAGRHGQATALRCPGHAASSDMSARPGRSEAAGWPTCRPLGRPRGRRTWP